jgi:hypothetical protein
LVVVRGKDEDDDVSAAREGKVSEGLANKGIIVWGGESFARNEYMQEESWFLA